MALTFIVIGTIHGGFLSQQLWGSTYAMWPLLVILVGTAFAPAKQSCEWSAPVLTYVISVSLLISGGFYVGSHERLDYASFQVKWCGRNCRHWLGCRSPVRGFPSSNNWSISRNARSPGRKDC